MKDPGQKNDVAQAHPEQVKRMREFYDAWWAELEPTFAQTTEIYLGHPDHPKVTLTAHDWIQEVNPPWNQAHIRGASQFGAGKGKRKKPGKSVHKGHWAVKVVEDGEYEIALRRWPEEANKPIVAELPAEPNVPGSSKAFRANPGKPIPAESATLRINGKNLETKPVSANDTAVTFTTKLTKGSHQLAPVFTAASGSEVGAYYTIVTKK